MSRLPGQALVPPQPSTHRATRINFSTADPLEARDVVAQLYGWRLEVAGSDGARWRLTVDQLQTPELAIGHVDVPASLAFQMESREVYAFTAVIDGIVQLDRAHRTERFGRGDVYLATHPHAGEFGRVDHVRCQRVSLAAALLDDLVRGNEESRPRAWRFLHDPPSPAGVRRWRLMTRQVEDLLADPAVQRADLVTGPAARLLAATALAVFPNTSVHGTGSGAERDGHPSTLRRAMAFIDANPDLDITLADIARAAHASTRAVQLAFRRQLDTTPMAYLRRVRLEQAHHELATAAPGDGLTVTQVALEWGFANPSRFAAYYRAAYGCSPSDTLRSGS